MTKIPPHHQLITTDDGSTTLFSERFQEACHSPTGAKTETLLHYVQGCEIEKKINQYSALSILEVGFGLGIGLMTTLESLGGQKSPWQFLSLEIDADLLEWFREQNATHPLLKELHWVTEDNLRMLKLKSSLCEVTILSGDARQTLPAFLSLFPKKFDAIYQDAFSPNKNPALWTTEWFTLIKEYSHEEAILSTYSSGISIRKSILEAGWFLQKGEGFGKKRTSTRAHLHGPSNPSILEQLQSSAIPALRDDNIHEFLQK